MPNPEDYTIGWICAITTEYVAAQEFLDGPPHTNLTNLAANNKNEYTLGSISNHNVVISVLPKGEYGTASAARVAEDMMHSFPNIRIGLMVGIGGGAPSQKHDIRLGDIVVGIPRAGQGGVFQYDFGKITQGKSFCPTGFLNQPPTVLRAAVSGLEAQYEREGHQIDEHIDGILKRNSRLLKKYQRPDPKSDRLYRSQIVHPENDRPCAETCGDDSSHLISRTVRTKDDPNPAIHYGLIGSANQLMKNALIRDKLATQKEVLCFEMEAAGLVNNFPCIVIRGICDYADTHKNDTWQGYAAMVAAAYARDLLYKIAPQNISQESRIIKIIEQGHLYPPAKVENHHWYFDVPLDSDIFWNGMSTGQKRTRDVGDSESSSSSLNSDRRKKAREESSYTDSVFDDYDPEHLLDLYESSESTESHIDPAFTLHSSANEDSNSEDQSDEASQENRQGPDVQLSNESDSEGSDETSESSSDFSPDHGKYI